MIPKRTNIIVPYILEESKRQKYMHFCGELFYKENTDSQKLYEYNDGIDEYIGYQVEFLKHISTIRYEKKDTESKKEDNSNWYFRLYFPPESIGTYRVGANFYLVNIYTNINGKRLNLYSGIINSYENLACVPVKNNVVTYQEYQDLRIININSYIRKLKEKDSNTEFSNLINIHIQPVYQLSENEYEVLPDTRAGISVLPFIGETSIQLSTVLDFNEKKIVNEIKFNKYIKNSFKEYIEYTFGEFTQVYLRYFFINKDSEEVFIDKIIKFNETENTYKLSFKDFLTDDEGEIYDLKDKWEEGLQIATVLEVIDFGDKETYDKYVDKIPQMNRDEVADIDREISIQSQPVSLTREIFSKVTFYNPLELNLKEKIDNMSTNINVINTIQTQEVQVNQSGNSSGIIKPVFFSAYPLEEIILHRDMNENISLNLDEYKGKVETFYLKLCGNYFSEYARTYGGVIFNINSSVITSNTGTYYICDADKNFITSGKYKCE